MNNDNLIDYFNGKKVLRKHSATDGDWFGFGVENGGYLPQKFAEKPPLHWVNKSLEKIKKEFAVSKHNGYRYLLKHDNQSFLEYCSKEPHLFYPPEVVDWVQLRTAKLGLDTRGFVDHYFYENFLTSEFFTIEGGLTKIIKALESLLKAKAKLRHRVIAIKFLGFERKLEIVTNRGRKFYDYVILTPTLKAIQSIDMKSLHLSLKKRVAFEVINYLDGIKIALQFKSRFWENEKTMNGKPIFGGQAFTDLPATTIVFPSTHLGCTDCRGVLLATYTHDRRTKEFDFLSDSDKVKLALKNMREIFGDIVIEQYTGNYYVKSWQNDELFRAISPYFDAGQFSSYYRELRKPEMNGRLHFANDIAIPHGSSSGSVNAAYFAIEGILKNENLSKKLNEFRSKWGVEREFI
ncbi:hypothetical protein B4U79_17512 [Dinothrombium tinctorium]|uniref:PTS EIIA type-2 domain-containing protein n=1 Tax=Dinothrombium tinctorium TaxID=1965070 RepID=A0A443R8I9_9ACAR|nr:hypothetical protein B4U79_17512 [Dinothrombium tinctorium]